MSDTTASLRRKIEQRRRAPIRRPHDEGAGRIEHRAIRAIGARAGGLLPDRRARAGRCFRGSAPAVRSPHRMNGRAGAIGAVVFGSDQGLVGRFNDVVADYAIEDPRRAAGTPSLGRRRARPRAPRGRRPVARRTLHRAELRRGHHLARRADSRRDRDASGRRPCHRTPPLLQPSASGALYAPVSQRLLPLDDTLAPELAARPWPTTRVTRGDGGRYRDRCARSSANTCSSPCSGRAPNPSPARTRAAWPRCSAPTRTSTNSWRTSTGRFHRLRQSGIDEELFDVIAGFEALAK